MGLGLGLALGSGLGLGLGLGKPAAQYLPASQGLHSLRSLRSL